MMLLRRWKLPNFAILSGCDALHPLLSERVPTLFESSHSFLLSLPKFYSLALDSVDDRQPLFTLDESSLTRRLKTALKEKNADVAWRTLQKLKKIGVEFPEEMSLVKESLFLLARGDAVNLFRAHKLLSRMTKENMIDFVDGDSLGLLARAFAEAEMFACSVNALRLMVQKHHHPSVTLWKTAMELWGQKPEGAVYVIKVFLEICRYINKGLSAEEPKDQNGVLVTMKPDKEAFNIALKACAVLGEWKKAEEIIGQMTCFAVSPDNASFHSLLKAYEKGRGITQMKKILLRMEQAHEIPNCTTLNALLSAYVNLGEIEAAAQLVLSWAGKGPCRKGGSSIVEDKTAPVGDADNVEKLEEAELINGLRKILGSPPSETYAVIVKGFLDHGGVADAAKFLSKLYYSEGSEYIPCSLAIEGVLKLGLRDEVNRILQELATQNTPADSKAYGMLVKAYCNLPQPLKGETVLHDARKAGHLLPLDCYDSLIDAYNLLEDYDCAFAVFREMKRHGVVPIESTFSKLLAVFERNAKPYLMRKLQDIALRDPPLKMEVHHWNRTIQSFCKIKLMFDAKVVMKRMQQLGFHPDATTYVFLLSGYILQGGKSNEILLLWAEIKENLAPKPDGTQLRLNEELLNGFLAFFVKYGYFKHAMEVIARMEEHKFWIDKPKLKNMYWHQHRNLYTSKHRSQRRVDMSQERRKQVEAFKRWVGLPP